MHDGVIPGAFTANVLTKTPNGDDPNMDMRKRNKRNAPSRKTGRTSFANWLRFRARAEEEETFIDDEEELDDEFDNDEELDDEFGDEESPCSDIDDDDVPEEFDDFDEEKELEFDDDEERAPFPLPNSHSDEEDSPIPTGRFADFFRMDQDDDMPEEDEENNPGGFEPGQAVGTIGGMGSDVPKIERARILMRQLVNKPGITRDDIIQQFIDRLPTTESTATSYYEDVAREMGLTGKDDERPKNLGGDEGNDDKKTSAPVDELPGDTTQELSQEDIESQDPNAQGITRVVDKSHLVYKRQMEDGKFEELWVYNIGNRMEDSLKVRREILSGTDIPRGHTKSEDGQQSYTLHTMGNAQLLQIVGLAN